MAPRRQTFTSAASKKTPSMASQHKSKPTTTKHKPKASTTRHDARKTIMAVDRDLFRLERRFSRFKDGLRELCDQLSDEDGDDEREEDEAERENLAVVAEGKEEAVNRDKETDEDWYGEGSESDSMGSDIVVSYAMAKRQTKPPTEAPQKKKQKQASKTKVEHSSDAEPASKQGGGQKKQMAGNAMSAIERKRQSAPSRHQSKPVGLDSPAPVLSSFEKKAPSKQAATKIIPANAASTKAGADKGAHAQSLDEQSAGWKRTTKSIRSGPPKWEPQTLNLTIENGTKKELLGKTFISGLDRNSTQSPPEVCDGEKSPHRVRKDGRRDNVTAVGRKDGQAVEASRSGGRRKSRKGAVTPRADEINGEESNPKETEEEGESERE